MRETKIQVELIDYTGCGNPDPLFAARKLAFTKATRLNMDPEGFERFLRMSEAEIFDELKYMVSTLPSSWEFVNATFLIRDVSRACAQQITRTRWSPMEGDIFGSYAMQAQRVVDVSDVGCYIPGHLTGEARTEYAKSLEAAMYAYQQNLRSGIANEDARGLLPMHVASNLVVEWNLRALTELCRKRSSMRVQGEYNEVVRQMRDLVTLVWPWSAPFFEPKEKIASALLEEAAREVMADLGGKGNALARKNIGMKLAKAADLLKVG